MSPSGIRACDHWPKAWRDAPPAAHIWRARAGLEGSLDCLPTEVEAPASVGRGSHFPCEDGWTVSQESSSEAQGSSYSQTSTLRPPRPMLICHLPIISAYERMCPGRIKCDFSSMTREYDSFNLKSLRQTSWPISELANSSIYLCWQLALIKLCPQWAPQPLTMDNAKMLRSASVASAYLNNSLCVALWESGAAFSYH